MYWMPAKKALIRMMRCYEENLIFKRTSASKEADTIRCSESAFRFVRLCAVFSTVDNIRAEHVLTSDQSCDDR